MSFLLFGCGWPLHSPLPQELFDCSHLGWGPVYLVLRTPGMCGYNETRCSSKDRIKEHKDAINRGDMKNEIAAHALGSQHKGDWSSAKVRRVEQFLWKQKVLEAIHIQREEKTFNPDCGLHLSAAWTTCRCITNSKRYVSVSPPLHSFIIYLFIYSLCSFCHPSPCSQLLIFTALF